jgi:hypothetical protein
MHRLIILLSSALLLAACQSTGGGPLPQLVAPGSLEGHVNIGPLLPVQRVGDATPTVPPEAYSARQIIIYQADGKTVVTKQTPDKDGNYRVELAPGTYVVGMARVGIDRARGLPATVTITSGQTTRLDIDIDTGIR